MPPVIQPCDYTNLASVIERGKALHHTGKFYVVKRPETMNAKGTYSITTDIKWAKSIKCEIAYEN